LHGIFHHPLAQASQPFIHRILNLLQRRFGMLQAPFNHPTQHIFTHFAPHRFLLFQTHLPSSFLGTSPAFLSILSPFSLSADMQNFGSHPHLDIW
jgi:hypothetical protein